MLSTSCVYMEACILKFFKFFNAKIFHKKIVESAEICRNLSVEILDGMAQEYRENAAYERFIET